jgi:hypothetical protein
LRFQADAAFLAASDLLPHLDLRHFTVGELQNILIRLGAIPRDCPYRNPVTMFTSYYYAKSFLNLRKSCGDGSL